ncbi:MAG: hypothetical protein MJH09_10315 [Cetobacterium sp.]|nr:hypothetical protein [Cetobacterium sp.]
MKKLFKVLMGIFFFLLYNLNFASSISAPGNSSISVQGRVDYRDTDNNLKVVKSNIIGFIVQPVRSVNIAPYPKITYSGKPGQIYGFYVRVTNTGNIPDQYEVYFQGERGRRILGNTSILLGGEHEDFYIKVKIPNNLNENQVARYDIYSVSLSDNRVISRSENRFIDRKAMAYPRVLEGKKKEIVKALPVERNNKFYVFNLQRDSTRAFINDDDKPLVIIDENNSNSKISFLKYQGIDIDDDNVMDIDYTLKALRGGPNNKIYYKIVLKNEGETPLRDVQIADNVPKFTSMDYGNGSLNPNGVPVYKIVDKTGYLKILDAPEPGNMGQVKVNINELLPGESLEVYFNVKIDM